jgi:hypothetical protein
MTTKTKDMVDSFGRTQEENKDRLEIMEAANIEAREHWDDPQFRRDFAADLTESILLGFEYETLVDRWIETERTDFNGRIFIREAGGLKAFYMARGGYIEASELTSEISEIPRDMLGVHVWEFEDKFLTNFAESAQTLRDLAIKRMDAEINRRIHTVLTEAVVGTYLITAAGVNQAALNAAISAVRDQSESGEVVITGRPAMVEQIMNFTGYDNETLLEIRQKGVLGVYRGASIVSLKNFKDEDGVSYMPNNQMWVMGRDTGKFAFFGGLKSKEFTELDNWYWHYLARRDTGVIVHHPERARRFVDTAITP